MTTMVCQHCHARFEALRSTARFCSDRCRIGAHRGESRPLASVWLRRASVALAEHVFRPAGVEVDPRKFDVSFGYPVSIQRKLKTGFRGGCTIGSSAIVIFPFDGGPLRVLAVLAHEVVHVAVGVAHRHGKPFQEAARAIGLLPPWPSTTAGPRLAAQLQEIATALGPMPAPFLTEAPRSGFVEQPDGTFKRRQDNPSWFPPRKRSGV
jgi:hypothetical protein